MKMPEDDAVEPSAVVVPREDRLEIELLHQKLISALHLEQLASLKLQQAQQDRLTAVEALNRLRKEVEQKYNINLTTHQILEDGTVTPRADAKTQLLQQQLLQLQKG